MRAAGSERDDVDFIFAETECGLDRFDQAGAVCFGNREPVLDDLDARAEAFDFFIGIDPNDFVVDPNTQIALLLDEIEESAWLSFGGHRDPECDQYILAGEILENVIRN